MHDINQIPYTLRQEAQARWGVNVDISAAREYGRYIGLVFTANEFVVQKVGERGVVIHRAEHIDFTGSGNLKKRAEMNRLSDTNLEITYDSEEKKAKAFFHDTRRAAIDEMFARIEKTASELHGDTETFKTFSKHLNEIKNVMVEQYREAKKRQFEQRNNHSAQRIQEPQERKAQALDR